MYLFDSDFGEKVTGYFLIQIHKSSFNIHGSVFHFRSSRGTFGQRCSFTGPDVDSVKASNVETGAHIDTSHTHAFDMAVSCYSSYR
jgi:hypothetical protein